jgi:hypothetical protein
MDLILTQDKQQAEQKRPVGANNKQNAKKIIFILANMVAIIIGICYVEKYKIFNGEIIAFLAEVLAN